MEYYVGARDLFEIVDGPSFWGTPDHPTDSRVTPCYLSALMKRFGMQITTPIILICVVVATSAPSLALDTAVPSCDVFKQRLGDAPACAETAATEAATHSHPQILVMIPGPGRVSGPLTASESLTRRSTVAKASSKTYFPTLMRQTAGCIQRSI